MRLPHPLLVVVAAGLLVRLSAPSLSAQIAPPPEGFMLEETASFPGLLPTATSPTRADLDPNSSSLSLRLEIWGDLFTDQEQAALATGSAFLNSVRIMERARDASPEVRDERRQRGSAEASAASWALVFGDTSSAAATPSSFGQPGTSLASTLMQRSIFMGADWAERSRSHPGMFGDNRDFEAWVQRTIALLPAPRGGLAGQAVNTGLRVGLISGIAGRWPEWQHMSSEQWQAFCILWGKRMIAASLAAGMASLERTHGLDGSHFGRSPLPVTLFAENY